MLWFACFVLLLIFVPRDGTLTLLKRNACPLYNLRPELNNCGNLVRKSDYSLVTLYSLGSYSCSNFSNLIGHRPNTYSHSRSRPVFLCIARNNFFPNSFLGRLYIQFCRATITNQALVDREGTFILLSASHSTRISITTAISSPFYMLMIFIAVLIFPSCCSSLTKWTDWLYFCFCSSVRCCEMVSCHSDHTSQNTGIYGQST